MSGQGKFLGELVVEDTPDEVYWIVVRPLAYLTASGELIEVPHRFLTDFASVPRILTNILPPEGRYGRAAIIHDVLYWQQFPAFPRERADAIFLEAMEALGVGWFTRRTLWLGVRIGGGIAWKDNAARRAAGESKIAPAPTRAKRKP